MPVLILALCFFRPLLVPTPPLPSPAMQDRLALAKDRMMRGQEAAIACSLANVSLSPTKLHPPNPPTHRPTELISTPKQVTQKDKALHTGCASGGGGG